MYDVVGQDQGVQPQCPASYGSKRNPARAATVQARGDSLGKQENENFTALSLAEGA